MLITNITFISKIKVVIIGQDPYHNDGQAHGLSFSVPKGIKPPPSLKNIYKELRTDISNIMIDESVVGGDLQKWTNEGVFLLNAFLTVE
jgi:uracil-DNA glycosylase